MGALYRKELKTSFTNMTGVIFCAFALLMIGIYTFALNFIGGYPDFEYTVSGVVFIIFMAVPILTMRSFSEERHTRTDQLLYSLPITVTDIVSAKFFSMCTVLSVPTLVMAIYPLILAGYGDVNFAASYSSILGFFLLGALLISVGMFISSLTESQVIAAVLSFAAILILNMMSAIASVLPATALSSFVGFIVLSLLVGLLLYVMTKSLTVSGTVAAVLTVGVIIAYLADKTLFEGAFMQIFDAISVFDRYSSFTNGIFDISAVIYYLSFTAVFFFFTVQSLEKRRWS